VAASRASAGVEPVGEDPEGSDAIGSAAAKPRRDRRFAPRTRSRPEVNAAGPTAVAAGAMFGDVFEFLADVLFAMTGATSEARGRSGRWWRQRACEVVVAAFVIGGLAWLYRALQAAG
jgi:hypothetical protein